MGPPLRSWIMFFGLRTTAKREKGQNSDLQGWILWQFCAITAWTKDTLFRSKHPQQSAQNDENGLNTKKNGENGAKTSRIQHVDPYLLHAIPGNFSSNNVKTSSPGYLASKKWGGPMDVFNVLKKKFRVYLKKKKHCRYDSRQQNWTKKLEVGDSPKGKNGGQLFF